MKHTISTLRLWAVTATVGLAFWAGGLHAQTGGMPLWTNYYGDAETYDLAVDSSGNVFVTGKSRSGGFLTIKYSGTGALLWTKLFNSPAGNARGLGVAADSSGNAFVTGVSDIGCATTIKYSATGLALWTNYLSADATWDIAGDAKGKVVVIGGTSNGTYLTAAYSNTGVPLWTNLHGPGSGPSGARGVAVDSSGNVVVTGWLGTVKYSAAGVSMWTNSASANAVAVDTSGNVFVTGGGITKYSAAGAELWTKASPAALGPMALDSSGNLYVAGSTFSTGSGNYDLRTVKYSGAGQPLWTNFCNGTFHIDDEVDSVVLDRSGNVFVYGNSIEELWPGTSDYFFRGWTIVAYRTDGNPLWTNSYESVFYGGTGSSAAGGAAVDNSGNLFVGGSSYVGPNGMASVTIKYSSGLAPQLAISRTSGSAVEVSWPSPSIGFILQQNIHADGLMDWSNVSAPIQDDGWRKRITVDPAIGDRWYRLSKP